MAQTKYVKDRGVFSFVKTWVMGSNHIGLLEGGGYAHFSSGLPVETEALLKDVIPAGRDRDTAIEWWRNRGKPETPKREIVFLEGKLRFNDGGEVTSVSDILNNTLPGPIQDAYLKEFHRVEEAKEKEEMREKSRISQSVKKIKAEALSKEKELTE